MNSEPLGLSERFATLPQTGVCEGIIGTEPKGENGFGYDPVFVVGNKTMAEMTEAEKNAISHRGKALAALQAYLKGE